MQDLAAPASLAIDVDAGSAALGKSVQRRPKFTGGSVKRIVAYDAGKR